MWARPELILRGERPQLKCLLERLDAHLQGGWARYHEAEKRRSESGLPGTEVRCFSAAACGSEASIAGEPP